MIMTITTGFNCGMRRKTGSLTESSNVKEVLMWGCRIDDI
jgi:hypothetical protein